MKNSLFLPLIFALSGCFYAGMDDPYSRIDPALQPYFDSFRYEAEIRGVKLDYSQVKISFGPIADAGMTYYDPGSIVIADRYAPYIDQMPEYIENIVFHELGHLLLHRGHDNERLDCGAVKSFMCSDGDPEYSECAGRKDYIDELFRVNYSYPASVEGG